MTHPAPPCNDAFLAALLPALHAVAVPDKAAGMARYMKSSMPFLGVSSPQLRATVRRLATESPFADVATLHVTVQQLWEQATVREQRYAAIMLTDSRLGRGALRLLPFYTDVIGSGQWWDYVDSVAPRLWELLQAHPGELEPVLRSWSREGNFWFRRAAIIAQLPAKDATDTTLLHDVLEANLADREFFVRKAIGWALRQYARTDPDWVRAFVDRYDSRLSGLSRREALKHLGASHLGAAPSPTTDA